MRRFALTMFPFLVCATFGCQNRSVESPEAADRSTDEVPQAERTWETAEQEVDAGYWERVTTLYDKAKASGETSTANAQDWISELYESAKSSSEPRLDETSQLVRRLYEQAKDAGETTAGSAKKWVADDIQQIGSWEYKQLVIENSDSADVVARLNELGADRWECFWVEQQGNTKTFYLKKAGRSYLRNLPTKDLIRMLPLLGGGDSSPE